MGRRARGERVGERARILTDEELKARIRECLPEFERKVAAGEIKVRGTLSYSRPKGPSIRPDPGPGPLKPIPKPAWGHIGE